MPKSDKNTNNPIVQTLRLLADNDIGALLPNPASAKDLSLCNAALKELDFPKMPDEYADFLKIHNGYAFDGVELYGTDTVTESESSFLLTDIVTATEDFNSYYIQPDYQPLENNYSLLCFGRQNGDYFTYDSKNHKYQVRSHECIGDVWDEYDDFDFFFIKEVASWNNEFENDDDGRYDAWI